MASGLQIERQPEAAGSGNLHSYSTEVRQRVNVRSRVELVPTPAKTLRPSVLFSSRNSFFSLCPQHSDIRFPVVVVRFPNDNDECHTLKRRLESHAARDIELRN
jgi:hypothetical protein